ncbi:hypothetical protein [Haloferula sp.]|uniref:hypothetical protein n=1 Tax=Haloferula sp. TaxID=2497595 RepID=UPI0032A062BC
MKIHKSRISAVMLSGLLTSASLSHAQTILFQEEFDGTTGYNPDSNTAMVGENDWVDFANRISGNFNAVEGYATAVGGTETVVTGSSATGQNDPQIRSDFATNFDKTMVGRVELRIRLDSDKDDDFDSDDTVVATNVTIAFGTSQYINPGAANIAGTNTSIGVADSVTAQSDGWHLVVWDDVGGLTGGGVTDTIQSLRIDPVNINPETSFEIDSLTFYESEIVEIDPVDPIPVDFNLKEEWTFDSDAEGWTVGANGHFTLGSFAGGLLSGISDGGSDPNLDSPGFEVLDVESGQFIIELGLVIDEDDDTEKQLFWKLGGGGAVGTQKIAFKGIPSDGSLHVVRINLDDAINDRITGLRFDPSNEIAITSSIDYVRIYSKGTEIPYFPPPVVELDPAPLGGGFLLQQEWDWDIDDDLDSWIVNNSLLMNPNDGDTGVFNSTIFAESIGADPQMISPAFSINPPASQQFVVEIDFEADGAPDTGGQLFWIDDNMGFLGVRSVVTPVVDFDEDPHTVRVTFTNNIEGALRQLRFDPTNIEETYFGIDAIRIYTSGPPVSTEAPRITSFSYDSATGDSEAVLLGNATTVYTFSSAADLDFTSSTPISLTGATVGSLSGGGVETDGSGNATVQFNLGMDPANFIRAED